jgi:uncharacterized HAD superfamily protein/adenine/guanine phosphoribosyltransferase-like PRPP-binding protein
MNFRSVADLNRTIMHGSAVLPAQIDLVIGIPRSGLLAANLLALHLNLPLTDVEGYIAGRLLQSGHRKQSSQKSADIDARHFRKVLVLDDSILSGKAMRKARQQLEQVKGDAELVFAAVYAAPSARSEVDFYFEEVADPRVFEWNFMHHLAVMPKSCIDIDGVLCHDPTEDQNDDGPLYRKFIEEARPLLIPSVPVGWLVTSRLEKFRAETEGWLRKHGVDYKNLIMLDLPDKESRLAAMAHAPFKAKIYKQADAILFVESNHAQAIEIAAIAGKPVLSIEKQCMVYPSSLVAHVPFMAKRATRGARRRLAKLRRWLMQRLVGFDPPQHSER